MSALHRAFLIPLVTALTGVGLVAADRLAEPAVSEPRHAPKVLEGAPDLSLPFVENRGQLDPSIAFSLPGSPEVGFTSTGLRLADGGEEAGISFLGASAVAPSAARPSDTIVNSYVGDPALWSAGISTYERILYREPWPGIDAVYDRTAGSVKYTFRLDPGADPSLVRLGYDGASALSVDADGNLVASTGLGTIVDERPVAWQPIDGRRVPVDVAYDVRGTSYGFRLGAYDSGRPLVIDPTIRFSGFIGGAEDNDGAYAVRVDDRTGQIYVTGFTESTNFPATGGDTSFGGDTDGFVVRLKPDGSAIEFASFLGGSGYEWAQASDVDDAGNVFVSGQTYSSDFPALVGPDLTYNEPGPDSNNDGDGYITKLSPSGSLVFSGFVGGNANDYVGALELASGTPYISGFTYSANLPVASGPDSTYNEPGADSSNDGDGFVGRVAADGSGFQYLGYLGGDRRDLMGDLVVDGGGNAVVSLTTGSGTYSLIAGGGGDDDVGIARVGPSGSLLSASRFGGTANEFGNGITLGPSGNVVLTGYTNSADFPVVGGPETTGGGSTYDAFVVQLNPTSTGLVSSGFLGGAGGNDFAYYVEVDPLGFIYVAGETRSSDFPVADGPDTTYNEPGPDASNDGDAFVTALQPSGTTILYSSFLGGTRNEYAYGIDLTPGGAPVLAGETLSPEFPAVGGPDTSFNGPTDGSDAFVTSLETIHRCKGRVVTHLGGSGNDTIAGTAGPDVVLAGGGDDKVRPGAGTDVVCAGDGNDRVNGGAGSKDLLLGDKGKDRLNGGAGSKDRSVGGPGKDRLNGGPGNKDVCKGGPGKDTASERACEKGKA